MIKDNKKNICPRILFYTGIPRAFYSTLIGYLYEISRVYPVVLLSEKLDSKTEEIIKNKKLFPKLEKIIDIRQHTGKKMNLINLLTRHRYFAKIAKDLIQDLKPDIVFATGCDIFESYLRRFAKDANAITIAGTGPLFIRPKDLRTFKNLQSAYSRFPAFLPRGIKILCAKSRKYLTHFFYYWISPLLVGQKPFREEPSCILWDVENVKGADYYFVFLKTDYNILINHNAPDKKLFILAHPLQGKGREIFEKINFFNAGDKPKKNSKVLTIMWPKIQTGFKRENFALIPKEKIQEKRIQIVKLIAQILRGWKIYIKPHPMFSNDLEQFQEIVQTLESISNQVKVITPSEVVEKYIEISDVIVGIPPASTVIFTTSLQRPEKPILSLDLYQEFSGDSYKNLNGIEYIDNKEKLIHVLELIRDDKYYKKSKAESKQEGFLSIVDALKWILQKDKTT